MLKYLLFLFFLSISALKKDFLLDLKGDDQQLEQVLPLGLEIDPAIEADAALEDAVIEEYSNGIAQLLNDCIDGLRDYLSNATERVGSFRDDLFVGTAVINLIRQLERVLQAIESEECLESTRSQVLGLIDEHLSIAHRILALPSYERLQDYLENLEGE